MIRIVLEMEPGDLRDLISSFISLIPKARALPPIPAPATVTDKPKPVAVASKPKPKAAPAEPGPGSTWALIADLLRKKPMTKAQLLKSLDSIKAPSSIQATLQTMRTKGLVSVRQDEGVHGKTNFLIECPEGITTGAQAIAH